MKLAFVMSVVCMGSFSAVAGALPPVQEDIYEQPHHKYYHHRENRVTPAPGSLPCIVAGNELMDEVFYQIPSRDVATVESCAESNSICVPTMDGTVVTARKPADLKGLGREWKPILALVQITDKNQSICLVATDASDGGNDWKIHGWRIESNKAVRIQGIPVLELRSDNVSPYDLVTKTNDAFKKSQK